MIPRAAIAGVVALCASAAQANTIAPQDDQPLRLVCAGVMFSGAAGAIESRITTAGMIDIRSKSAGGFGIGRVPVLFASAGEIRFGTAALDAAGGQPIEGWFDRESRKMSIRVRSRKQPTEIVIRMELACKPAAPVS